MVVHFLHTRLSCIGVGVKLTELGWTKVGVFHDSTHRNEGMHQGRVCVDLQWNLK